MKAARLHRYHEALAIEQVPEPRITDSRDVIVRIGGAGLCRTDLHVQEGLLVQNPNHSLPLTLGHENAGWVHEVGSAVSNVAVGDTVIVHPMATCGLCRACRAGDDIHCENNQFPGITADGGFAELFKATDRSVVRLDSRLHPRDIAALADAGLTAYHAIKKAAALLYPGTRAVVIGAGGLGHIGIQVLRALTPAEVIVIDPSEPARELAARNGADSTLASGGDHIKTVLEMTDGRGAEVVLDFVGEGSAIADGIAMLRDGGSYYVIGYGGTLEVPTVEIISREINFIGNFVGSYNDLAELMTLTASGKVSLQTTSFPLEAVNEAMADLAQGRLLGRGIIEPN